MAVPPVKVYLASDTPWTVSPTWVEVTSVVKQATVSRSCTGGHERQFSGGSASFTIVDDDGDYDPDNTGSTWSLVDGWIPVKIDVTGTGASTIFRGWTAPSGWQRQQSSHRTADVSVSCVDAVTVLNQYDLDMGEQAAQWSAARIRLVLNNVAITAVLASWPASWVEALDADGTVYVDSFDGGGKAWSHIQEVARAEGGVVFVTRAGVVKFYGKHTAANNYSTTPSIILTDDGNASHLPLSFDRGARWRSRQRVMRSLASAQSASDQVVEVSASVSGEIPTTVSTPNLPVDTNAAGGLAEWNLERFGPSIAPKPYPEQVTVRAWPTLSGSGGRIDTAAQLDIGSHVRVEATPVGQASQQTYDCAVRGVRHSFTQNTWDVTLDLEPERWWTADVASTAFLRLDHATLGQLNQEALGY